jgi:hypothetical protein
LSTFAGGDCAARAEAAPGDDGADRNDRTMRAVVVSIGASLVVGGLAATVNHALLWQQSGIWTPTQFSVLWYGLGGVDPDRLEWLGIGGIMAWLLDQPLNVVLLVVGGSMVWIGLAFGRRR